MTADPFGPQTSAIAAAVNWIQTLLVGQLATMVGIIAIAGFGLLMLTGRMPTRRGIQVILGCFIIFGASPIAAGIIASLNSRAEIGADRGPEVRSIEVVPPLAPPKAVESQPHDAYAGFAVPPRR